MNLNPATRRAILGVRIEEDARRVEAAGEASDARGRRGDSAFDDRWAAPSTIVRAAPSTIVRAAPSTIVRAVSSSPPRLVDPRAAVPRLAPGRIERNERIGSIGSAETDVARRRRRARRLRNDALRPRNALADALRRAETAERRAEAAERRADGGAPGEPRGARYRRGGTGHAPGPAWLAPDLARRRRPSRRPSETSRKNSRLERTHRDGSRR